MKKIFLGKIGNILKSTKDKNVEYSAQIKRLELSVDHSKQIQLQLMKIHEVDNKNYLIDIETVLNALSNTQLSQEVEIIIRNWYYIKKHFDEMPKGDNDIVIYTDKIFTADFEYELEELLTQEEIDTHPYDSLTNSEGIQQLLLEAHELKLMEYSFIQDRITHYDDTFKSILGKYVITRYKDLVGEALYDASKNEDLKILTNLMVLFIQFIEEERENIVSYISSYSEYVDDLTMQINELLEKQLQTLIVLGSILNLELIYSKDENRAQTVIYKANKYYRFINTELQKIVEKYALDVVLIE